jgi:hypothetical protein
MKVITFILPFLFCLLVLIPTTTALDVRGDPLLKYTAGINPSFHKLNIFNDGESTIILSQNLEPICTFTPHTLNSSGQFIISCTPTEPVTGYVRIVPKSDQSITYGVQIPVQLGEGSSLTQTPSPTPTETPQQPEIPVTIIGLSLNYVLLMICCAIAVVSGIYYLLFVHKYD